MSTDADGYVELPCAAVANRLADVLEEELGLGASGARATLDHLIRVEQSGKDCHGLIRVHYLARSGKFGPYAGVPTPEPEPAGDGWLRVQAAGHLGYPVMDALTRAGCDVAARVGRCLVTASGVYPSGCLGDWARLAADRGVAAIILAGSPPRVAAPAGSVPLVGTNPICVGVPADPLPFVCDAATSAITHGDLLLARDAGRPLPPGSAVDSTGRESLDPREIDPTRGLGALLSVGGSHKTFALALAIELLTSLGGGVPGSPALAEHGIFALFLGPEVLADSPERFGRWLAKLDGEGVRIPGWESGRRLADQDARKTVRIARDTLEILEPWLEPLLS